MSLKVMHLIGAVTSLAGSVFVAAFTGNLPATFIVCLLTGFNIGAWVERYGFRK